MQGYFESFLNGQKKEIDKILNFISEQAKEDDMYSVIQGMIQLPVGYDSLASETEVEIGIGMQGWGSGNINFFREGDYFLELAETFPNVDLRGNYQMLDSGPIYNYISRTGSETVECYYTYECRQCLKIIGEEDLDHAISLNDIEDLVDGYIEEGYIFCGKECFKNFIDGIVGDCNEDDLCPNCGDELDEDCFVDKNGYRFCSEKCYNEFNEEYNLKENL
ncbi:MAG: hypothetical protein LIO41_06695 [Ruminococcus sp.]|nr:hypothetical protein [Ruminococcus sp.]